MNELVVSLADEGSIRSALESVWQANDEFLLKEPINAISDEADWNAHRRLHALFKCKVQLLSIHDIFRFVIKADED